MKVKYFEDTDTALVEFSSAVVSETREVSENVYVDLDANGNLVSMTIEHAKSSANLREVSYEEMVSRRSSLKLPVKWSRRMVPMWLPPATCAGGW